MNLEVFTQKEFHLFLIVVVFIMIIVHRNRKDFD